MKSLRRFQIVISLGDMALSELSPHIAHLAAHSEELGILIRSSGITCQLDMVLVSYFAVAL